MIDLTATADIIGDNQPPPEEVLRDQLLARYGDMARERDGIMASAETWQGDITTKAQADAIVNLEAKIVDLAKRARIAHDSEKLPHKKAVDVIDGFFLSGIIKQINADKERIAEIRGKWQRKDANAKRQRLLDEARQRQEEADALRRAEAAEASAKAEAERRAALRRNPHAEPPPPPPPPVNSLSPAAMAQQEADRAAAKAAARPAALSRIVTDLGASRSLSERPKGRIKDREQLTDEAKLALFPFIDITDLDAAANRYAIANMEEGKPVPVLPGCEFTWKVS